jgi:streptomycin 6-kinase
MLGARGQAWLDALPSSIAHCAEQWRLQLDRPFAELSYNYAAPGLRADGMPVVLKVCIPGDEFFTEAGALRLFDGRGAVRLLEVDIDRGALLIERLLPGTPLNDVSDADDERATHIAAEVMQKLWRPVSANDARLFPTVATWIMHMEERAPRLIPPGHRFPRVWLDLALAIYRELTAAPAEQVLLHGDLHHGNILAAQREPWLAIDPKGVIGEPAWETGPLFINQLPEPLDVSTARRVLIPRAKQLASELGIDYTRLAAWAVVRAVLSGYWTVEEHGESWDDVLIVAEALAP